MKIFLTYDYELFFGSKPGTVKNSIIRPVKKLLKIADLYNINYNFFVDVGYLIKLNELTNKKNKISLKQDFNSIYNNLKLLMTKGHDLQLHIHPHWEDSTYHNDTWKLNTSKYRLHEFDNIDIINIITKYKNFLEEIKEDKISAFRAGGWSIQPFNLIKQGLIKNDILIDSTVFKGGYYNSNYQYYNFKSTPNKDYWKFENDPLKEDKEGKFIELPISSIKLSPRFYIYYSLIKLLKLKHHKPFGDGNPIQPSSKNILNFFTKSSISPVSLDGFKSKYILNSVIENQKLFGQQNSIFVAIGHPKAQTNYSLKNLEKFIRNNRNEEFFTYDYFLKYIKK